jgi:hypothetical protein
MMKKFSFNMKFWSVVLLTTLVVSFEKMSVAQLVINEVQITNLSTLQDEDQEFSDWFEIYNSGNAPVELGSVSVSDRLPASEPWFLPDMELNPGQHLLVFSSGKNRYPSMTGIDHFEVPVFPWNYWTYIVPTSQPAANWNEPGFNDASWLGGNGGIGFADGDDQTEIPWPATSVFARTTFTLSDADEVVLLLLTADYDDAFVCYLNGVEIARANIGEPGVDVPFNALAIEGHEANGYQNLPVYNFLIDQGVFQNALVDGENVLAVQVHNADPLSSDLTGNFLLTMGVSGNDIQTNEAPEWLNLDITEAHTSFGLSQGETLFLTNALGEILDSLTIPAMQSDHVFRRSQDGAETWCFSNEPTPDAENEGSCFAHYESQPEFSAESGVYPASVFLILSSENPEAEIRYTTDGSYPTETSTLYELPIIVSASAVVSARAFSNTALPSMVEKNTYMVQEYALGLPIISVSTDPANLWDPVTGIHVFGPEDYDPWYPHFGANFWEDWERLAYVEYFDSAHIKQMEGPVGIKIHGGWSRGNEQKSFRIQAKGKFGMEEMVYPMIPDKPYITAFKGFNLRNGGNAYAEYRFHEALIERTTRETNVDYMSYAPAIVFLNGEYWGFMEIRENLDQHYIANNHDISASDATVVSANYMGFNVINGNPDSFYALHEYATQNDPSVNGYFDEISSRLDIENYADYIIAQTYWANGDWSNGWQNNTKLWHDDRPGGKWRFMLMDMDFGMGLAGASPTDNYIQTAGDEGYLTDQLFGSVILNETFRNHFINRYADLINTEFQIEKVTAMAMEMKAEVLPIFQRHAERWNTWGGALEDGLNGRLNWAAQRVQGARDVVQNHFGLPGQVDITLDVLPAGAGRIHISTIEPGTELYPWTGVYFQGVPVRITAIENPGFSFSHWLPNALFDQNNPNQNLEIFFEEDLQFVAVFEGNPESTPISITELMFNPDDQNTGGDWLEIHNNLDMPVNLSGWSLSDNNYFHQYTFPLGTMIGASEYMILPMDASAFAAQYPEVEFVGESLGFGFSNSMDVVTLKSPVDSDYISFSYSDSEGDWLKCSDGCGHTRGHLADNADYTVANWFLECENGSPGEAYEPCGYEVIVNEINYNSAQDSDAGDWLELSNTSSEDINLAGWTLRDGGSGSYSFNAGTVIPASGYLVIAGDLALFSEIHNGVDNLVGPSNIALGNNGDMIRLYDAQDKLVFSMQYDQYAPWPFEANGIGKTLEFSGADLGFCNPLVWFAGCPDGSPGVAYYENCNLTAIDETIESGKILIYPNPADERLFVLIPTGASNLEIFDAAGRLIQSNSFASGVHGIDLSQYQAGFYMMVVKMDNGDVIQGRFFRK